jgi:hypothetical protein
MLTALGRKLGLIRPSGVLEVFPPDAEEEWWTLGGPSLVLTEKGIEELFWPDDLPWPSEASPMLAENAAAPDKPAEGENQLGAA